MSNTRNTCFNCKYGEDPAVEEPCATCLKDSQQAGLALFSKWEAEEVAENAEQA